jgi:glucose repression regulatory protein TUP1
MVSQACSFVKVYLSNLDYSVLTDESAGKAGDLYIRGVCFSPDGKLLATGGDDKQIRVMHSSSLSRTHAKAEILQIWDIVRKKIVRVFDGHQKEIYSLDFSLDGRLIVSGSADKTVRIWDLVNVEASPKVGRSHPSLCSMITNIYP